MRSTIICVVFVACTQTTGPAPEDNRETFALGTASRDVYIDAMGSGFVNWSWSGNYTFGSFITAQVTSAWGALAFKPSSAQAVSSYSTLSFHASGTAGAVIYVSLEPTTGAMTEELAITLTATSKEYDIPVAQIDNGATSFGAILFKSAVAQTFYIDNVRLNVPPQITSLTASAFSGGQSTLSWATSGIVRSATLNGTATANDGSETVTQAGTYTLAVTGLGGTSSRSVTVASTAPAITAFSASPATISQGGSTTLTWTITGSVTSLTLDGATTPNDGTQAVTPSATKTYTLVANGPGGSATRQVTVTVNAAPPVITAFGATPASIAPGATSSLQWTITGNVTSVTLNGSATINDGNETVAPPSSTVYTLVATGPGGSANASVSVTVTTPPATTRAVFTDSYQNGFAKTSAWFSTYEVVAGAIHVKAINDDWQGLELTTSQGFAAASYGQLQLRARGSGTFHIEVGTRSFAFTLSATDTTFTVPIASLWPSGNVTAFLIKNAQPNAEAFIDWIQFSGTGSAGGCTNTQPASPLAVDPGEVNTFSVNGITHWVSAPASYDSVCHSTPKKLFVWLHGCGGRGEHNIYEVMANSNVASEDWIALAVGGAEDACWNGSTAQGIVLGALANLKTRLAIKTKEVSIGGYSSGGDAGYPIIFNNSKLFALALFENTAPANSNQLIANAAPPNGWRFPIRHLCHTGESIQSFKCESVRPILGAGGTAAAAGHSSVLFEMSGGHWEDPTPDGRGTWPDFHAKLRPYLSQTFTSP